MKNKSEILLPGPTHLKYVQPKRGRGRPRKNGNGDLSVAASLPQIIFIGGMTLAQHANHNIWLSGGPGHEPMQVNEFKLEKLLKKFHRAEY